MPQDEDRDRDVTGRGKGTKGDMVEKSDMAWRKTTGEQEGRQEGRQGMGMA